VHVPHAATAIPTGVRAELLLDDGELEAELIRMTDWHVDKLFAPLLELGATMFVNRFSRLVFDPERFTDDAAEPAAAVGQGVVYTQTSAGWPLRRFTAAQRSRRIAEYYDPYHVELTALVAQTLDRHGRCLILDCHSFPGEPPLPAAVSSARPDICLGTDEIHSPPILVDWLQAALVAEGFWVLLNEPFAGTLVPMAYYGRDSRVSSIMIEVRRELYANETTGQLRPAFAPVQARLAQAIKTVLSQDCESE